MSTMSDGLADNVAATERPDPSALRWLIGHELRIARTGARKTQVEAAEHLGCSHSKINRLEIGRGQAQPEDITALLRFYAADVAHVDRLASLAGYSEGGTWWAPWSDVVPDWLKTFVGLEDLAAAEFMYEPQVLPGLLQTRAYLDNLLDGHLAVSRLDSERVAGLRMQRQRRLLHGSQPLRSQPLRFTTVVEEVAFARPVGGAAVLANQLGRVLELAERDNITLHVMPTSQAVHDGLDGRFVVLQFPNARPVAYLESPNGARYVQDSIEVEGYLLRAKRLCDAALSIEESKRLIANRITELEEVKKEGDA